MTWLVRGSQVSFPAPADTRPAGRHDIRNVYGAVLATLFVESLPANWRKSVPPGSWSMTSRCRPERI